MTESQFYYGTALMAREQRRDGVDASAANLLTATGNVFTMTVQCKAETDEFREELLKVASIAMRLATKDAPPDIVTGKMLGRATTEELHESNPDS